MPGMAVLLLGMTTSCQSACCVLPHDHNQTTSLEPSRQSGGWRDTRGRTSLGMTDLRQLPRRMCTRATSDAL